MVYLLVVIFFVCCAVALAHLTKRPDPHHILTYSVLPMLDLEHNAGARTNWAEISDWPKRTKPARTLRAHLGTQHLTRVPR